MKSLLVGAAGLFVLLVPAAGVDSARPPALLSYSAPGKGICLARADGTRAVRVTSRHNDWGAAWSPRGTYVAFNRQFSGRPSRLLTADTKGRVVSTISRGTDVDPRDPTWSPDGRRLAFAEGFNDSQIIVARRDGTHRRAFRPGLPSPGYPDWSPDGTRLAFASGVSHGWSDPKVHTARLDGTDVRLVALHALGPDWSPDGSKIAYVEAPYVQGSDIFVADADGSNPRALTSSPEAEGPPKWSPDGTLIAFERRDERDRWIVTKSIVTGLERVVVAKRYHAGGAAWRPPFALTRARRPACR